MLRFLTTLLQAVILPELVNMTSRCPVLALLMMLGPNRSTRFERLCMATAFLGIDQSNFLKILSPGIPVGSGSSYYQTGGELKTAAHFRVLPLSNPCLSATTKSKSPSRRIPSGV